MINERQAEIMEIVANVGNATVEDLADHFGVSKMTIRRDLERLHQENLLQRTHGGAMINKVLVREVTYQKKREKNQQIKKRIADAAFEYIAPHASIFLDAGTTTFELASKLINLDGYTIITNDLMIALLLYPSNNTVFFIGGQIQQETGSSIGLHAVRMLEGLNIDIAFLAASSISSEMMIGTPDVGKQALKQAAIEVAEKKVLLVDHSKFLQKALYKVGPLKSVDVVVTDYDFSDEQLNLIKSVEVNHV